VRALVSCLVYQKTAEKMIAALKDLLVRLSGKEKWSRPEMTFGEAIPRLVQLDNRESEAAPCWRPSPDAAPRDGTP